MWLGAQGGGRGSQGKWLLLALGQGRRSNSEQGGGYGHVSTRMQVPCSTSAGLSIARSAVIHGAPGQPWVCWPAPGEDHPQAWAGPGPRLFFANPTAKVKWLKENL